METSLHQQLKAIYAASPDQHTEVQLKNFRSDAIASDGELVEIQHGSLGALRNKTCTLLEAKPRLRLRIVKPIVRRKRLTTVCKRTGEVLRSRMSPKTGDWLDLFQDLVHFAKVFPRNRLTLEVLLIDAEETRIDRPAKRHRGKTYRPLDIQLIEIHQAICFRTAEELLAALPVHLLPDRFDTAQLAAALDRPRWFAQKVSYCLREMGAILNAGKSGNAHIYQVHPNFALKQASAQTVGKNRKKPQNASKKQPAKPIDQAIKAPVNRSA